MQDNREKLRQACWHMLERDLIAVLEEAKVLLDWDSHGPVGRAFIVDIARLAMQEEFQSSRKELESSPEPERTKGLQLLEVCERLADEFFMRQKTAAIGGGNG